MADQRRAEVIWPDCYRCAQEMDAEDGRHRALTIFFVCPDCGNKRCPKATNHRLDCTGSNEVGQKGSVWENAT